MVNAANNTADNDRLEFGLIVSREEAVMHLFYVSYDKDDVAAVENVCGYFRQVNFPYWFDRESMNSATDHKDVLEFILRAGGKLLSFFSKSNCENADSVVQKDFRYALDVREKYYLDFHGFLPVKIGDCTLPDIQIHPKMSLRHVNAINSGLDRDIGIDVLDYCGKSANVIDFSTRNQFMASMVDFFNPLQAVYGTNLFVNEIYDSDPSRAKMLLKKQTEYIERLFRWGEHIVSIVKMSAAKPEK